jgi:large subunit ribosomal protein L9
MQVILLERVEKLGQMGDEVTVKPGFARNYLLPRGKALRATTENKARFETEKAQLEAQNLDRKSDAEAVAKKMDGASVILVRQAGESGQLYGSVNARDITEQLIEAGYTVNRNQVRLDSPIKTIGLHDVVVSLHPEVAVSVSANVARSIDEAETQASTGKAVLSQAEEESRADEEARKAEAETVLTAAAEAVADQAEEIFEDGAAEEAVAEAETVVEDVVNEEPEPIATAQPESTEEDAAEETGGEANEDAGDETEEKAE